MSISRAANPKQYDGDDIDWLLTVDKYDGWWQMCFDELSRFESSWIGKEVIDIGCGTAWLTERLSPVCSSVMGIEPSVQLFDWVRKHKPKLQVQNKDLMSFETKKRFDLAIGIMVFVHLEDVEAAFEKIRSFANELIIIVPAFEYYKSKRFDYRISVEDINDEEYVATVKRDIGSISDFIRKTSVYEKAARGWTMTDCIPIKPSLAHIESEPKYKEIKDTTISYLLRFSIS